MLQQPIDIERWIGVGRAGRIGTVGDTVVAVLTPSVERRGIVVGGFLAIPQIPPHYRIELGVHRSANAVGQEQTIHETGGLFSGVRVDGIVFSTIEFDSGGSNAQVVVQLLA
jgi:hypothetical protein